jgi:hypothetical protein
VFDYELSSPQGAESAEETQRERVESLSYPLRILRDLWASAVNTPYSRTFLKALLINNFKRRSGSQQCGNKSRLVKLRV